MQRLTHSRRKACATHKTQLHASIFESLLACTHGKILDRGGFELRIRPNGVSENQELL